MPTTCCTSGDSSRGYNAAPRLGRIKAVLLAINAADDERNPPETGLMERELKRVPGARMHLIPASVDTRGRGATGRAKFYAAPLKQSQRDAPKR